MRIFEISDFDSNFTTNTWTQSSGNGSFAFINDNKYYWETEGEAINGTISFQIKNIYLKELYCAILLIKTLTRYGE